MDLRSVADEQAALRRVATLVAQAAPPQAVFDAVCEETGRLIGATTVNLAHFTPDGINVTISGWSDVVRYRSTSKPRRIATRSTSKPRRTSSSPRR